MKRRVVVTITGVLLVAAGAQASIGWTQSFAVGAVNQAEWLDGVGSADAVNKASFDQRQQFSSFRGDLAAFQKSRGTVFQNATVTGPIGPATSRQDATINGSQNLATFGGRAPNAWGQQNLNANLTNQLVKPAGVGHVNGIQNFVGEQRQGTTTPFGSSTQSQYVETMQRGSITTNALVDPTVTSTIDLRLNQSQITNGF